MHIYWLNIRFSDILCLKRVAKVLKVQRDADEYLDNRNNNENYAKNTVSTF